MKALFHRLVKFKQLHYLRDPSLEAFGISYDNVIIFLVHAPALAAQLESEPGNVIENLEMSILCRELLTSNISVSLLNATIAEFAEAVDDVIDLSNPPLQKVIECLREANPHMPGKPDLRDHVSLMLSRSLFIRFNLTKSNDDYEDVMAILDKPTTSYSPADVPSPYLTRALYLAAMLAFGRFQFYANPEHLEEVILRFRFHLNAMALEDSGYQSAIQILEQLERRRFEEFGITNSLQELPF